jgi:tripartite-type tricarboxylate transporter receptor subunit TctC
MRIFAAITIGFFLIAGVVTRVIADDYPSRPVTVILPYPPAGLADLAARTTEQGVGKELGQPLVVEYKPGGGGMLGANVVKSLAPDGYSLLIANATIMAVNPSLMESVAFDPMKDFTPITMLVSTSHVLVVPASSPIKSLQDLLALIKQGKPLTFASSGIGGGGHLLGEMLKKKTGGNLTHVPYKGAAPAMQDVLAGRIDFYFESVALAVPYVASGGIRPIAVTAQHRLDAYPGIPTMAELGYPDLQADSWFGLFGPKGLPANVVDRLNAAFGKTLHDPNVVKALQAGGLDVLPGSPDQLRQTLRDDLVRYRELITAIGAKIP